MKKYIILLLVIVFPVCGWACDGINYGSVSMTNLPEKFSSMRGAIRRGPFYMTPEKLRARRQHY